MRNLYVYQVGHTLPSSYIRESSRPRAIAVVAAPIRKLCPVEGVESIPMWRRADWRWVTRADLVKGVPDWNWKSGPTRGRWNARNLMRTWTGQRPSSMAPRYMLTPWRSGSVLLCLIHTLIKVGLVWLSRARSPRLRWTSGSYAWRDRVVNSPACRNPNKPVHAAA